MSEAGPGELASVTNDEWEPFLGSWGRWFDSFADRFSENWGAGVRAARTDVTDTGPSYRVTAELPGIPKEKLEITVQGTTVELRAKNEETSEPKGGSYLHQERRSASFYRGVELPEPVSPEKATARLTDGVLVLELPKLHPEPVPTTVKVPVQ